jgi:hypothetical protein
MKRIELFDRIIDKQASEDERKGTCMTLCWAYEASMRNTGNELIDFDDCIWDDDPKQIAAILKQNGIDSFTISSSRSNLMPALAEFEELGYKVCGMTKVKASYYDWDTGELAIVPALLLKA